MADAKRRHTRVREALRHVETTLPDEAWAKKIAKTVLEERLASCVQWWQIRSQYRWNGDLELAGEFLVMFKTTLGRVEELQRRLHELHPYELPYVATYLISHVSPRYAQWAADEVAIGGPRPNISKTAATVRTLRR
ncbi:MAG TPA: divalent-cation tolerance protein CutA [Candidatus Thermoplasmatota archaeon]